MMKFFETRRQIVFGIACLVLALAVVYAGTSSPRAKYRGLVLQQDIQMDEEVRSVLDTRIATSKAAIKAQKGSSDLNLDLYENLAFDAILRGDLVLARETYEEYFQYNAINYTAWNNYAKVLRDMGDNKKAEDAFKKAIELSPSEGYYNDLIEHIRRTQKDEEREDEIFDLLKKGVTDVGQTPFFMVELSRWYMANDDCQNALDHLQVAKTLIPDNESLTREIGEVQAQCAQQ